MNRKTYQVLRLRKRSAFSLLAVLVIAMVGMAIVGAIMHTFQSSVGATHVVISKKLEYNLLQDGVEKGKSILKSRMNNTDPPPRGVNMDNIDSLDDLLLEDGVVYTRNLGGSDLAGGTGRIVVQIFDMEYNPANVHITEPGEMEKLPPSILLGSVGGRYGDEEVDIRNPSGGGSSNSGAYLIRATLEINDAHGDKRIKVLDTSILQSNLSS
jgi:hypothetical protein